jgi:fructose 5-dehydrogenase small subunit
MRATRRALLGGMAAFHAALCARLAVAQVPAQGPLDLDGFLALSQGVTGHGELDPVLGSRVWEVIASIDGGDGLERLRATLADTRPEPGSLAEALGDAEMETVRRLLQGWYLGRIETGENEWALTGFERTLMGRVTADILPLASYCGGAMGFWADPPEAADLPLDGEEA